MTDKTSERLTNDRLTRRAFLGGAAGLAGALALGLEGARPAAGVAAPSAAPLTLAFWNGTQLVDAARLSQGDPALCGAGVRVTVHGRVGAGRTLRGLTAFYPIGDGAEAQLVPFHAWGGSPHGSHDSSFCLPHISGEGLRLSVRHTTAVADAAPRETPCLLSLGDAPGQPKLRAGTYVLAAGGADWSRCHFEAGKEAPEGRLTRRTLHGFEPVDFDYLLLTVSPA